MDQERNNGQETKDLEKTSNQREQSTEQAETSFFTPAEENLSQNHATDITDQGVKRPKLLDGIAAFLSVLLLWYGAGYLLKLVSPYFSTRQMVYVSGFLTQFTLAFVVFILAALGRFNLRGLGYRAIDLGTLGGSVAKAFGLVFLFWIIYASFLMRTGLTPPEKNVYSFLLSQRDVLFVALNFLLAAVFAPVLEETVFRGVLYGSLRSKLGIWPANLLSAALFSGLHLDVWGFANRMFLGSVLAYLYEKHKSLYPSIALHALNNGLIFLLSLVVSPQA